MPKVSGYIRRINVDIGDRTKIGEVLAVLGVLNLMPGLLRRKRRSTYNQSEISRAKKREVTHAQADYVAVHAAYTRLAEAAKQRPGLIAEQELDDARAKDQDAEAKINVAKSALEATEGQLAVSKADNQRVQSLEDYSIVTAPFTGVVTMRYADVGSLIQAGTASATQSEPVVRVAQSDLFASSHASSRGSIAPTSISAVRCKSESRHGREHFAGKVIRFTRELNTSTRTMLAEVDIQILICH